MNVQVAINGYGVIGKRVADAVRAMPDMDLVGVADVATDWRVRTATERGIPVFAGTTPAGAAKVQAGMPVSGTLAELLDSLESNHKGIRARILDDAGQLRRFVNVYVGDEDVRFSGGLEAPVPEGAKVSIIPAVAGG